MARNLGINIKIGADLKQFSTDMQNAQRQMRRTSRKFKQLGSSMTKTLTLPLGLMGGAMIKFASDTQESLNKVDVAFGDSSNSVKEFANTTLKSFGIARGSALDMAATFGDMGTSMGLSQERAAEMSMKLVGLAGDLASFKNIRIDVAQTALNSIFTGETESLKKLGIVMTQANLSAFALEQGITKPIKAMSEGEKTMLRYQFVMDKTANAHGDFERTGGGAANQMRIFQEGLKELGDTFGQIVLPMFTNVIKRANDIVKWFGSLSESTKKVILVVGGLAAALGPVALGIGAIIPLLPTLLSGLAALISPIGLIVAGLTAVAVVVYKNWDKISDKFWEVYDSSKPLRIGINGIALSFKAMYEVAKLVMGSLWDVVKGVGGSIADFFGGLGTLISGVFTMDLDKIKEGFSKASNSFKDNMGKAMSDISQKSETAFRNMRDDLSEFVDAVANESETLSRNPIKIKVKTDTEKTTNDDLDSNKPKGTKRKFEDLDIKAKGYSSELDIATDATDRFSLATLNMQGVAVTATTAWQHFSNEMQGFSQVAESAFEVLSAKSEEFKSNMVQAAQSLRDGILNLSMEAFEGFFEAIGKSLTKQEDAFKNFGQETLLNVANFMGQFGKLLVAGAIASEAMQKALFTNPILALGAGIALIATAGLIKGMTKQNPVDPSGSNPSYTPLSGGGGNFSYGNTDNVLTLETVVYGRDIVLSSNRQHGTISRTRRK